MPWQQDEQRYPTVRDGRYPPRGYEPARRNPPSALSMAPEDFMDETFALGHQGRTGATATMAPQLEQMRIRDRDARFNAERNFPDPASMANGPRVRPPAPQGPRNPYSVTGRESLDMPANPYSVTGRGFDIPANPLSAAGRTNVGPGSGAMGSAASALRDVPTEVPPTQRRATDISPSSEAMGPNIPGGGRPSAVNGVFRRDGASGVPEFYNLGPDGRAPDPLTRGGLSVVGTGLSQADQLRYAQIKADDALRRRGGGGGGGTQFSEAREMREQAQKLFSRAESERDPRRKSPMLKQARALMGMAESTMGAGAQLAGQQAQLDQEAMRQRTATQNALREDMEEQGLSPVERAQIAKLEAETGNLGLEGRKRVRELLAPEAYTGGMDLSAETLQVLQMAFGSDAGRVALARSELAQRLSPAEIRRYRAMPPEELADMPELVAALAAAGYIEGFAEGGYVEGMDDIDVLGPELGTNMQADPMSAIGMGDMQADPMQMEYEQYAQVAKQLDLPVIPFEQFAQIMLQAQQQAEPPVENFADGGPVPRNQFGYGTDPATGRSPVGQAAWGRHNTAMQDSRPSAASSTARAVAPSAMQTAAPTQPDNFAGYGPKAESYGLDTSAVRSIRDSARASGTTPSYGRRPSSMGMSWNVEGFADGGPIPVGGKMVFDPDNPNAATDTIPAVIDGERPAALKSGEFVFPDDVVMFYGTDKLNKMMEAARKGPEDASVSR